MSFQRAFLAEESDTNKLLNFLAISLASYTTIRGINNKFFPNIERKRFKNSICIHCGIRINADRSQSKLKNNLFSSN